METSFTKFSRAAQKILVAQNLLEFFLMYAFGCLGFSLASFNALTSSLITFENLDAFGTETYGTLPWQL